MNYEHEYFVVKRRNLPASNLCADVFRCVEFQKVFYAVAPAVSCSPADFPHERRRNAKPIINIPKTKA